MSSMTNTPYLGGQQQAHSMHPHPHSLAAEGQQRFFQQQQQQQQAYPPTPHSRPSFSHQQQQPFHHRRSSSNAHLAAVPPPNPVRHPSLPVDHPMYQQQQQPYPQDPVVAGGVPPVTYPPNGSVPPPASYYHPQQQPPPHQYPPHHHRSNSSSFSAPYPPPHPYPQENAFPPSPRSIQSAPDQHSPRMDASRQPSMVPHPQQQQHPHPSRHYKTPSRSIDAQDLMIPPPPSRARMSSPGLPHHPQPMRASNSPPFYPTRQPSSQTLPGPADPMQQQLPLMEGSTEPTRHHPLENRPFYAGPPPPSAQQQQQPYSPAEQEMWMERERLRHQQIQPQHQQQQAQPQQFQPDLRNSRGYMHEREYDPRERSEHEQQRMWAREQQQGGPAPPSFPQQQHHPQTAAMQVPPPQEGMVQAHHGRPQFMPPQQQQPLVHPSAVEMQPTVPSPHPMGSNRPSSPFPPPAPLPHDRNSGGGMPNTPAPAPSPSSMAAPASKNKHARQPSTGSARGSMDHRKSVLGKRSIEQLGLLVDAPPQPAPSMRTPASPPTTPPAPRFLSPDNEMNNPTAVPLLQGADHYQQPLPPQHRQSLNRRSAEWMPPPAPIPMPGAPVAQQTLQMQQQPNDNVLSGRTSPALTSETLGLKAEPGSANAENGELMLSLASNSTATLTPPSPPTMDALDMPSKLLTTSSTKGPFVCTECPKVYKSQTALLKHQWEHNPHWGSVDNDPDLNKNQQIQLMEAAQILLDMRSGRATC